MKKIILQKDLIDYLNKEIIRVRQTPPEVLSDLRNESYINGYKEGQIYAFTRILNHIWLKY